MGTQPSSLEGEPTNFTDLQVDDLSNGTFLSSSSTVRPQWSVEDPFLEGSHLWSILVAGYSLVFTVGVIGNVVLLAALCGTGNRARALPVRNHLLVNLALADLLVTAICVPITACAAASHACWPGFLVSWMCQLGPLLQRTPVAASTLSLALLSLDRWAALRHPRFTQRFREKRFVALSMVSIWILASLVAAPTFWAREWEVESGPNGNSSIHTNSSSSNWQWEWTGRCLEHWTNAGLQLAYAATYLGTAFVSPALIVAACHASVSQKLTAQLQGLGLDKARTKPKQVIIVAREPTTNIGPGPNNGMIENSKNPSRKLVPCDPNSDDDDIFLRLQIQADLESFRQISEMHQTNNTSSGNRTRGVRSFGQGLRRGSAMSSNGNPKNIPLRAARRETSIIRAHRRLRKKLLSKSQIPTIRQPPPLLPTYSSQSFRSRRRAANLLAALAIVFVFCWAPHVVCALWEMFATEKSLVRLLIPFSLFLGHAHSAINPVVSWRLNRSAFVRFQKQPILSYLPQWAPLQSCFSCCSCPCPSECCFDGRKCVCCSCCCRNIQHSSSPEAWNRNSSTNEANLGAFHPRFLNRLPLPDPISKCHTSHFLR